MDIGRTEGVGGPGRIDGTPRIPKPAPSAPGPAPADRVELSRSSRLVSEALGLPPLRQERIEEVRRLLASGELGSDARLQGAVDRFLDENPDLLS